VADVANVAVAVGVGVVAVDVAAAVDVGVHVPISVHMHRPIINKKLQKVVAFVILSEMKRPSLLTILVSF
jgi:hypothetical protein